MSKRTYHLRARRSWWDGSVVTWCGKKAPAEKVERWLFATWRSDFSPCVACVQAQKAGRKP